MSIFARPRDLAELTEIDPAVPAGLGDRFSGYGVMGLPFASGQVLAFRRFPASSLGYGYSSVWHRDAEGRWTFWSDIEPSATCARFFGAAIARSAMAPIRIRWTGGYTFQVTVGPGLIIWSIELQTTATTLLMNALGSVIPWSGWQRPALLRAMGRFAGPLLGAGEVRLTGRVPNGQEFRVNPARTWLVHRSVATVYDVPVGDPRPLQRQAFLGDFAIPQRGLFSIGRACFDTFDPTKHSDTVDQCRTTESGRPVAR